MEALSSCNYRNSGLRTGVAGSMEDQIRGKRDRTPEIVAAALVLRDHNIGKVKL